MGLFTDKAEKFLEIAAHKLCEKRGMDANERIIAPQKSTGYVCDVATYAPRWQIVKEEIEDFLKMVEAMDEAEEEIEDEARASALEDE